VNGQTFFEHQSYLGTERARTNYLGAIAAKESSLSYGDDLNQTVSIAYSDQDNNQFAGQEHDVESGSEHAQFRQYSSTQGRWMSPDPYDGSYHMRNPQSLNRYTYASNRPSSAIDWSGKFATDAGCDDYDDDGYCNEGNPDQSGDGGETDTGPGCNTDTCTTVTPGPDDPGCNSDTCTTVTPGPDPDPDPDPNPDPNDPFFNPTPTPTQPQNAAPNKPTKPCGMGIPCHGPVKNSNPIPIQGTSTCHAAAVLGLSGLMAIPGVDIPIGATWTLYVVGGASAITGVTLCW
jgi:RHS repeat-associated protein